MGVKGLWSLLNPVARPIQIESMEGKRLAIDSSIWLYQFQATMRDKDGRVLVNAHVLGFLRRINKLLFHGIKPVFVFDGGAPVLKRATIAERKRRKAGAAANHARMAEKLFAAQMRREAVKVAQTAREEQAAKDASVAASRYANDESEQIAENAVYLEDLEGRPGPSSRPPPQPNTRTPSTQSIPAPPVELDPKEERRKKFKKHDPYRLPEANMPTVSTAEKPDARLATEEELKQFIDEMHPEDIDVDSAEFRALPTEVQYEIIAEMLRAAPTALDFSMAQIKHLSQRNALTQQLLTVTDMVGKAHLTIPIRIAAERNREYVLVKRGENEGGGWALGIREGTKANPIKVEDKDASGSEEESDDESDTESDAGSDIEEVKAVSPPKQPSIDPDLREFRRREMLDAIVRRYAPAKPAKPSLDLPVKSFGKRRAPDAAPLFVDQDDDLAILPTANDEALALALQQEEMGSDEETPDQDLAKALALSRVESERKQAAPQVEEDEEMEEIQWSDKDDESNQVVNSDDSMEDLEEVSLVPSASDRSTPQILSQIQTPVVISDSEEDDFVEVVPQPQPSSTRNSDVQHAASNVVTSEKTLDTVDNVLRKEQDKQRRADKVERASVGQPRAIPPPPPPVPTRGPTGMGVASTPARLPESTTKMRMSVKPVSPVTLKVPSVKAAAQQPPKATEPPLTASPETSTPPRRVVGLPRIGDDHLPDFHPETPETKKRAKEARETMPQNLRSPSRRSAAPLLAFMDPSHYEDPLTDLRDLRTPSRNVSNAQIEEDDDENYDGEGDDSRSVEWSKSPSPQRSRPSLQPAQSGESIPVEIDEDEGDMNRDDMDAEEDDYARFMASIKNRDLNEVRTEIDNEIRVLNNQAKVALRDSDEITQAMISQIQTLLRHFGIPYITAPMEAEAQCAKLAELDLVDGIITDDSDVFLFGGKQCFKNIFNDAKYAECFLLTDIERELSLTRERLISLAYLLGSDYTIGLPGVGPVVALELLANFPGESGISDFKEWWTKVQRGQDQTDTDTKWKKSFKKRYSTSIFLTNDWPNLLVREAYKYPDADLSEEPFHWGFPKLSALRAFLHEELSWSISKVDDELTPIVQRIARRGKVGALNKQSTLNGFFDLSIVSGNYAPRRRTTANVSKRLMSVIKQFREAEAKVKGVEVDGWGEMMGGLNEEDPKGRGTGKAKGKRKQSGNDDEDEEPKEKVEGEEGETVADKKKRKSRPRKGTVSSVAQSEGGSESVVSATDTTTDSIDAEPQKPAKVPRGKAKAGRGRGRGTRRWVGERWDVIQRPD